MQRLIPLRRSGRIESRSISRNGGESRSDPTIQDGLKYRDTYRHQLFAHQTHIEESSPIEQPIGRMSEKTAVTLATSFKGIAA